MPRLDCWFAAHKHDTEFISVLLTGGLGDYNLEILIVKNNNGSKHPTQARSDFFLHNGSNTIRPIIVKTKPEYRIIKQKTSIRKKKKKSVAKNLVDSSQVSAMAPTSTGSSYCTVLPCKRLSLSFCQFWKWLF